MSSLLLAIVSAAVVCAAMLFVVKQISGDKATSRHSKRLMNQLYQEQAQQQQQDVADNVSILKSDASPAGRFILSLPFIGEKTFSLMLKAGVDNKSEIFLAGCVGLFVVVFMLFGPSLEALLIAAALTLFLPRAFLRRKINKRNEAFINMFPDAVDMIVRSVKSGHPLNTALRMIAENMDSPVREEFKQLVDEIAFGRTTTDALQRMSQRVDEPDLHFFVVILSVQQETGGNLAEVLSNLSNIIRKRKQLRLKIKAMTSEGRATAYILGALPLLVFGAIHMTSPDYLTPLFTEDSGRMLLATAIGLVALAAFIVYNMLQIDI